MAEKTTRNKILFQIIALLGALIGIFFLVNVLIMWIGSMVVTPLGFLFGLGEAGSYATISDKLTNLFWHVVPGLAGAALCILLQIPTLIFLWGSLKLWHKANQPG